MRYSSPRAVLKTFLARVTFPKKIRCGAEQSVIVQGLHHWDTRLRTRAVNRGRYAHECVVHVYYVWPLAPKHLAQLLPCRAIPHHVFNQCEFLNSSEPIYFKIAFLIRNHFVAVTPQQILFLPKDCVFAARLLI